MRGKSLGIVFALCGLLAGEGRAQHLSPPPDSVPVKGELVTYVSDAAWLPGEERILINDPRARKLVPLRRDGQLEAPWSPFPGEGGDTACGTSFVREADATCVFFAYLWQPNPGKLCFAADGRTLRRESLGDWLPSKEGKLFKVDQLLSFGGEVVGSVFLLPPGESEGGLGIVRLRPKVAGSLAVLRRLQTQTVPAVMTGRPLLAATATGVYYLDFDQGGLAVVQLLPQERRLRAFPAGLATPPPPPSGVAGPSAAWTFESTLESLPVPLGLFALDDRLLLLTRSPDGRGTARWQLFRLDPQADRLEGSWELPTRAPGILLVPGEKRWAILELGELQPLLERKLLSLVEIPASALRRAWSAAAPPAGQARR